MARVFVQRFAAGKAFDGPEDLPGFKGPRVLCGEGINFKREVVVKGRTLCHSCAGDRYYRPAR